MVDIHCHILPEVDDGSRSWEMTREMCRVAAEDGITHIVATPHANDQYAYDRVQHLGALSRLQALAGEWPQFALGCDFHLSYDNITDALAHPRRYVVGNTPYLLVEFSDFGVPPAVLQALHRMVAAGMQPVVTHPERNATLQRAPEIIRGLIEMGCVVQVTASSLTGFWGEAAQRSALALLARDMVHVLASDAHNAQRRAPLLSSGRKAAAAAAGEEVARALVDHNPRAIFQGEPLPYFPPPRAAAP